MSNKIKCSLYGFTLSELLIALAILGVIATFTIPKILVAQQEQKKLAVMKETISMLNEVIYIGMLQGDIRPSGGTYTSDWILDHVNAVKICDDVELDGCWDNSEGSIGDSSRSGFVLANGAVVVGPGLSGDTYTWINIDWNGTEGPNQPQQDQIGLGACYDSTPCLFWSTTVKPGTLGPLEYSHPDNSDSTAFYQYIFSH